MTRPPSKRAAGILLFEVLVGIGLIMAVMTAMLVAAHGIQRGLQKQAMMEQHRAAWKRIEDHIRDDLRHAVVVDARQTLTIQLDDGSVVVLQDGLKPFNRRRSRDGKMIEQDVAPWPCMTEKTEASVSGDPSPWKLQSILGKSIDLRGKPVFVLITIAMLDEEQHPHRIIIGATTRVEAGP